MGIIFQSMFVFILIITISAPAIAGSKKCSLKGEWFDAGTNTALFKFKQEGNNITMESKFIHPTCGAMLTEGTIEKNNFNFKAHMTNSDEPYCNAWSQIMGTIEPDDCAKLNGEITFHWMLNDVPYENTLPFHWVRNIVKITGPSPGNTLVITAEPRMPEFKATAVLQQPDPIGYLSRAGMINYSAPLFAWSVRIQHSPIPGKLDFDVFLDEAVTNEETFTPDFSLLKNNSNGELINGGVMGGELTLSVEYYKAMRDEKKYTIKGMNPGKTAIEQILTDSVTRYIACQESKYQQFEAKREGGIGFPVVGRDEDWQPKGGIGIMQIFNPAPTAAQAWNWRENLNAGITLLAQKRSLALTLPRTELKRLNSDRAKLNLPFCRTLPLLSEEQVQRETLRRYNGGREYRWEPRNDPNCEGSWVVHPTLTAGSDSNYVEKVMSCKL